MHWIRQLFASFTPYWLYWLTTNTVLFYSINVWSDVSCCSAGSTSIHFQFKLLLVLVVFFSDGSSQFLWVSAGRGQMIPTSVCQHLLLKTLENLLLKSLWFHIRLIMKTLRVLRLFEPLCLPRAGWWPRNNNTTSQKSHHLMQFFFNLHRFVHCR